jgi:hypothetical protein
VPQGSILGTLLFLLYINDLPKIINKESVTILLADDTSTLFMHSNPTDFNTNNHKVFEISNKWFKANLLSLNFEKTQLIQFINTTNMLPCEKVGYDNKTIPNISYIKFLGLTIDNTLSLRNHTDL